MLLDPRRPFPQFLATLDRWITGTPPAERSICRRCDADCTGCEWALSPEGAERLGLHEDDLVCWDCERLSRDLDAEVSA